MPEAAQLEVGNRYRKHLENLFRGFLALARETHVKQGGVGGYGGGRMEPPLCIAPNLTVEPLVSLYERRADCYRFVRSVLEESFGPSALDGLHRLIQEGPVDCPLSDELTMMETLFDGAAATARRELGMVAVAGDGAAGRFADWKSNLASDQDVRRDCRMMVPVFYDVLRKKTKVWALLGWRRESMRVSYSKRPVVLAVERERASDSRPARPSVPRTIFNPERQQEHAGPPSVEFVGESCEFAVPVMAEVYVERLLDRDEFRRHCGLYRTRSSILSNLR